MKPVRVQILGLLTLVCSIISVAHAAQVSDVAASKHNLATGPVITSADTDRVCVFCHTPHGAKDSVTPLWNRDLSVQSYTLYDDTTLDALKGSTVDATLNQPGGTSKLCLSCHDGTIAIGKVNVFSGTVGTTLSTVGAAADGTMPAGDGVTTGFTRDLGVDLRNDHPISFTYDSTLAGADGELFIPKAGAGAHIDERGTGALVPLENDQVQCTTCHDPHVIDDTAGVDNKFVREGLNRFQVADPTGGIDTAFSSGDDILCLACHTKDGWSNSVHANLDPAGETYTASAAAQRDFPTGIAVWEAACLNCHDTHTVQGARRLLREGTDSGATPKAGGFPAQEETCYQCHDGTTSVLSNVANVPDIKSDFALARRMPIAQGDVPAAAGSYEQHSITDKDFTESTTQLGMTAANRHAECTDCHNPHRMMRNAQFDGGGITTQGTHLHDSGTMHTNEASGVLSGTTGVEPSYGACGTTATWDTCTVTSYTELKGSHDNGVTTPVTKEYQVCLKCHSDYAYTAPPALGSFTGGTPSGTNGLTDYTDQAKEFQGVGVADAGNAIHVSFHPVRVATGRNVADRNNMSHTNFLAPFNNTSGANIGSQTMYCTDCHGSETAMGTSAPTAPNPWGPHGSGKDFILKGNWDADATTAMGADATSANPVSLCLRCHDYDAYSNSANNTAANSAGFVSGFSGTAGVAGMGCAINATVGANNLHLGHVGMVGNDLRCSWCHVAVPHGWRNKALLVDITQEPGCAAGAPCDFPPYYSSAMLGFNNNTVNWKTSGNWTSGDCGGATGAGSMNAGCNAPP